MLDYEKEYKALLKRVADLEDTLLKFMRNTKDELENLDIENFSESFKAKQDNASLQITRTAKELSVKMEDYDTSMVKMQSEIKQTASSIKSEVKKYAKDQISTAAETITAESITQTVSRAFFEVEKISVPFDDEGKDTDKIYYSSVNGKHYYYNSIAEEWRETSSKSIYSAFVQTDDGFEFNGDVVKISGDLIVGGTLSGSALKSKGENITLTLGETVSGNYGDLTLTAPGLLEETVRMVFQIYDGGTETTLKVAEEGFLSVNDGVTYPLGTWDFTSNGTSVVFEDGVNAIAVFG